VAILSAFHSVNAALKLAPFANNTFESSFKRQNGIREGISAPVYQQEAGQMPLKV
jgi:hypothetical protein